MLAAITLVVAIFLSACNSGNGVKLQSTTAKGEVPQLTNLVFRFNRSLYPDSLLDSWDSSKYVSFKPAINGRFRWSGPDELVFSPAQPLQPATNYTATINKDVLRFSSFSDVDSRDISFHTTALQLEDVQMIWVLRDENSKLAVPQFNLVFNYPVKTEDVRERLKVEIEGKEIAVDLVQTGTAQIVSVRATEFRAEDRNYEARVKLAAGLKPVRGTNGFEEEQSTQVTIPSPFVLNINDIKSEYDGTQGTVHVYTSQQMNGENIQSFVSFSPKVKYTVQYEDYGFTISSDDFDPGNGYVMQAKMGLRGRAGGVLKESYQNNIAFGQMESEVRFTNTKGIYLSSRGSGNIEVRISNTPKVKLVISKIYENNLLMVNRHGFDPPDSDEGNEEEEGDEESSYQYASYNEGMGGDVIYSKEIDTRSLPKSNGGRILNLKQFEDRMPDVKGIYHVMIRSTEDYWIRDSRLISFSDIGLVAKQGADKVFVFANSIRNATAINGVTVNVYGANNQLLGTAATNGDGVAEVPIPVKKYAGFRSAMVIAKTADDFTYLPYSNTLVNTSRFDVGGKSLNPTGLDAFVYAERDIYRPGETINYSVVVRDGQWKSPGLIPVKLKFLLPNGKELKLFRRSLNEQGGVDGSIPIATEAITGTYVLEVYSTNDILLATKNFMIEEFVPDRIRVSVNLDRKSLQPSQTAVVDLGAANFFGPPAADRNYELDIQVKQKEFSAKGFEDYNFALANVTGFFDGDVRQGKTNAAGKATESFSVPPHYVNSGLLQANFYATVFDETGRPVSKSVSADIFTQDIFHGIKSDGYGYYPLNQPVKIYAASVNRDGRAVNAQAHLVIIKHEYRTVLTKAGSYFRYESQPVDRVLSEVDMNIGNNTAISYVPRSPGDFEIRISRPGSNSYVSKHFYSYGSWGAENSSFEVNNEGHVDIDFDRASYKTGEKAEISFKAPFNGRLLVTVENSGVLSYHYLDVVKKTASMKLDLPGAFIPNVYITATLIKAHEASDIPLTVAHGFKSLKVDDEKRKINVQINALKSVRSKTHQKVEVTAAPGSYVTLAAVDNGVLQVSDFKTPDPYTFFYQKRALAVSAYDMYPLLFPELKGRLSSTGGDGEMDMNKRVNPVQAKRFKIMSYWSGMKKADGSGKASFEFDIPQFSGEVRLMAVAFRDEKFGASEAAMTVADPIVLSTALPRFISPGDTVLMPLTLSNTTSRPASGSATVRLSGGLSVAGGASQAVQIQPNNESRLLYKIVAGQQIGVAKVNIEVVAAGEKFVDQTEISIRPASTLQKLSGSGSIAGGQTQRVNLEPQEMIPSSVDYELVVSRNPAIELGSHLRYLVQYPYGCTEQTVSAAFPQLYFADLADLLKLKGKEAAASNVNEAIRKIKMRQLYNGAVTLWDGEGAADWWATVYSAHFLLEARKAGFDVDNSLVETMLSYLINRLKTMEVITYTYNRNQNKRIAAKEVAYSLYVLSLAGRPQGSVMNFYKAKPEMLALDSKYLLSAAYAAAGDRRSFQAMLPSSFSGEASEQETGGSFYSFLRDEAIALNALVDVDPGNAQVPVMAAHVAGLIKNEPYPNTQERVFSFLALGKLARTAAASSVTADVRVNGKSIAKVNGNWKGTKASIGSGSVEIVTTGKGRLYYTWVAEGISVGNSNREEDNYLRVSRKFYDRNGKAVSGTSFRQNDLVVVELTLEKTYNSLIQNIVLTDLLPAGFEIENPRVRELPGMDWIKDNNEPTAMDIRDDRIHFFVDAMYNKQKYYYVVRAVSPGIFRQGPVSADAMYNGEIHSYRGAQTIRILQ